MHRAHILHITVIALALAACSSTGSSGQATTSVPSTSSTSPTTTLVETTIAATTTVVTVPATTPVTAAATTLPPAAVSSVAPPPPDDGCVRPDSSQEPVELVITDDGVTLAGLPLTICAKVPESFRFSITNNSSLDQFVGFGDAGGTIAVGATELTDPMGELYFVGDHFPITMAWIEWTIDVEVLPVE